MKEVYAGQENDNLPARGELGTRIQGMVGEGLINVVTPFHIENFEMENGQINVMGNGSQKKDHGHRRGYQQYRN
ncbi:hypothetical protein D3C73_1201240 [compost metagenome]